MYACENFKTRKALVERLKVAPVPCYQPGPFGPDVADGWHCCEGPHYPAPHRWYAWVRVFAGAIVQVRKS